VVPRLQTRTRMRWIVLGLLALSTSADAGDAESVTAASVAAAPLPGHESGRIDEGDGGDGAARIAVRGLLFVPKLAIEAVEAPIRGAVWLNARYDVTGAYERVFFNDAHTIGVLPTGSFDTHFGWSAGARFIARDLFDEHESFDLGAAAGETWRVNASSSLRSGKRLGDHVEVALAGSFERHPNDIFYGIGNGDLRPGPPAAPIDPRVDDTAILARYRYEMERVALVGDYRQDKRLHVRATGSMEDLDLGPSMKNGDDAPIDVTYASAGLVGLSDVKHAYGELEVRYDGRDRASPWDSREVYSSGGLAAAFAGRVHRLDPGRDFTRYGGELQYYFRLADGPRVLATRFHFEGVTGTRDDVPLTELPKLGGAIFLRGYDTDRFRDVVAAVASAQYGWDLSHLLDAALFVDVGRVYPGVDQLSLDHLRCGFGAALDVHGDSYFLTQISVASSIDGGIFFNLAFNRAFDGTAQWR